MSVLASIFHDRYLLFYLDPHIQICVAHPLKFLLFRQLSQWRRCKAVIYQPPSPQTSSLLLSTRKIHYIHLVTHFEYFFNTKWYSVVLAEGIISSYDYFSLSEIMYKLTFVSFYTRYYHLLSRMLRVFMTWRAVYDNCMLHQKLSIIIPT